MAQIKPDNREIETRFFQAVVNEKDFDFASKYLGDWYTEHDRQGVDGPSGLNQFIDFLKSEQPLLHVEYSLTSIGESLSEVCQHITNWAINHIDGLLNRQYI